MTPNALLPALFVPLILFSLYRRFRRTFGRQPIQRKRMTLRIGVLGVVLAMLLISASHRMDLLAAAVAGLVAGGALAFVGLRMTRFEITPDGKEFYTPNGYIGMALMALLIGRLIYRFTVMGPAFQSAAQYSPQANPFAAMQSSPLTLGIITVMIGYYLVYFIGILREGQKHGVT